MEAVQAGLSICQSNGKKNRFYESTSRKLMKLFERSYLEVSVNRMVKKIHPMNLLQER